MGLMPKSSYEAVKKGKPGKGLMCVLCVTRIVNHPKVVKDGFSTIESKDARLFFSKNGEMLRKLYHMTRPYLTGFTNINPTNNEKV
jgi:hypothetical protein